MGDTEGMQRRWWQAEVPPWATIVILSWAGLWGLIIGFNWI